MNIPSGIGFERKSLPDQIADALRQSIIAGVLPAGTRLLETELAQQFAVSRAALREALWMLESEGLVESRPNRGSYVAQIAERDIVEIYSLRSALEGLAARLVAERATPEQFAALQALVDGMIQAARADDHRTADDLDLQFHRKIWELSGHRRLIQMLSSMQSQIQAFLLVNTGMYQERLESILNHQALLDTIRSGNADAAEQAMRQHVQYSVAGLLDYMRRMQAASDSG
jgi:DNA-binding GntR family transcriptional regulator